MLSKVVQVMVMMGAESMIKLFFFITIPFLVPFILKNGVKNGIVPFVKPFCIIF